MDDRRLATLLRIRSLQRDIAHHQMLESRRLLNAAVDDHRAAVRQHNDAELAAGTVDGVMIRQWWQRVVGAAAEVRRRDRQVAESTRRHDLDRGVVVVAERRVQGLQRLHDRHEDRRRDVDTRRERAAADEFEIRRQQRR